MTRILAIIAIALLGAMVSSCSNSPDQQSSGPGALMSYHPQIAFVGGNDSFSTRAEPLEVGLVYEVSRGFVDRIDIEIDGNFYDREYILDRTRKGKFLLTVDISHLDAGDHTLRVIAHQGERLPRPVSGRTSKLPFVIIR